MSRSAPRVIRAPENQRARRLGYRRDPQLGRAVGGRNLPSASNDFAVREAYRQGAGAALDREKIDPAEVAGFKPCLSGDCDDVELHEEHPGRTRRPR